MIFKKILFIQKSGDLFIKCPQFRTGCYSGSYDTCIDKADSFAY